MANFSQQLAWAKRFRREVERLWEPMTNRLPIPNGDDQLLWPRDRSRLANGGAKCLVERKKRFSDLPSPICSQRFKPTLRADARAFLNGRVGVIRLATFVGTSHQCVWLRLKRGLSTLADCDLHSLQ